MIPLEKILISDFDHLVHFFMLKDGFWCENIMTYGQEHRPRNWAI